MTIILNTYAGLKVDHLDETTDYVTPAGQKFLCTQTKVRD